MNKNLPRINIRTDLALESAEALQGSRESRGLEGVEMDSEFFGASDEIKLTSVIVKNAGGERLTGKPAGNYITLESAELRGNDVLVHEEIIKILAGKLSELKKISRRANSVLIVGLGNRNVTPDSLGPKVVSKVLITRHIMDALPGELQGSARPVAAVAPGVMGLTGIETGEIVKGVCEKVKPGLVIAIDALAARNSQRINAAIQLSDTGINPGSGMDNSRMGLNERTLGVPVIAIGVPTVVDAATLVNDTLDLMLGTMIEELPEGSAFLNMLNNLESEEKYDIIRGILDPHAENMFVAPKDSDAVIERLSNIIANAVNIALHPGLDGRDINRFVY